MTELPLILPADFPAPGSGEVLFVPLGGVGEIGMNVALYGHAGAWLMVDLGVTFGDDTTPGVDLILPDLSFAEAHRDRIAGLVLTHAHEDHVGAVPFLWRRLGCPVYTTPFTAAFVRRKLAEEGGGSDLRVTELPPRSRFRVGPFDLEFVTVAHSIPEPNALAIRTSAGTVLHTGDWKIDPDPVAGPPGDEERLRQIGDDGVLAMVCDSTNAVIEGASRSEAALNDSLTGLVAGCRNRVVFTCFASNIGRLNTIAAAAAANERRVAVVGRSLRRMDEVARETGYLDSVAPFLSEEHVGFLPRDEVALLCTGSQGEPRAALSRIAAGTHPNVVLDPGDTVVFSSRTIPGNERSVDRLQDLLVHQGIEVITNRERFVHVSGHPARDELRQMYAWVRPRFAVPVHGELRHLYAHAALARDCGVERALLVENGTVVAFTQAGASYVGRIPTGRLTPDGDGLAPLEGEALRARRRMLANGSATVFLVVDGGGRLLADPQVSLRGIAEEVEAGLEVQVNLRSVIAGAVDGLSPSARREDEPLRDAARRALQRTLRNRYGKRPMIDVHVVRLRH